MNCPKCGNRHPISLQHKMFFPFVSKAESDRRNYAGTTCQICGNKWDKVHSLSEKAKTEVG